MTINGPAIVLFAMYLVVAERQGVRFKKLRGTLQNDILKEYIAQKEWISPPPPSLKLINDIVSFSLESAPLYHPISISGYHIREAGSTRCRSRVHALGRTDLRPIRHRVGVAHGRLCAAPVFFL